jgi:hypothetical protein
MWIRSLLVGIDVLVAAFEYIVRVSESLAREKRRPKLGSLQQQFLGPIPSMNIYGECRRINHEANRFICGRCVNVTATWV